MNIGDLLKELTEYKAVSGFENGFANELKKVLENYCSESYVNKFNSVIGIRKCGELNAPKLMLEAHLDQIGLMVSKIDQNGFISFVSIGGVDERILPAAEIYILGKKDVYGVIGAKPPHLKSKKDAEKNAKIEDMLIDTGYSKEELQKFIKVGDPIILKSETSELLDMRMTGRAMDNTAGIAAIIYCLEQLKNLEIKFDLYIVFSSEEELGLHGAYTTAYEIMPDYAIAIDVTHGTTTDTKERSGVFDLDSGAIICRGPNLHNELTKKLLCIAQRENIPYKIEVAGGNTGTTAWAIQATKYGVATMLISIPLKYMHTTVETLSVNDIENVSMLLFDAIRGGALLA